MWAAILLFSALISANRANIILLCITVCSTLLAVNVYQNNVVEVESIRDNTLH